MKRAISRFGEIHSSFLLIKHMENKRIDPSTVPPFVLDYKPYPDNFISSSLKDKLEKEADIKWDKFYEINQSNFFKDRHWILKEFPELLHPMDNQDQVKNILEVGCGVGNTTFPLCKELSKSGKVFFYSFDFAKTAVELLATHEEYDATKCKPFVCDVVRDSIPNFVPIGSINVVIMIFVLSAISPEHYPAVIEKLYQVMAPGGIFLIRDYGRGDMAEKRFTKNCGKKKISENFFVRKDGTRAYYSTIEEFAQLFQKFETIENKYVNTLVENKKQGVSLERIFIQGKFRKK